AGALLWGAVMTMTMTEARLTEARPGYWSAAEIHRIVDAAFAAPRWGVRSPWVLEFRGRSVQVYETAGEDSDRLLACGAVVTNVRLAIRTEGWAVAVRFRTDPDRPDLVAEVTAGEPLSPTVAEADEYAAVHGLRSTTAVDHVRSAVWCPGVELRAVGDGDFLVLTTDDGRLDRVRAGAAAQSAVLAARAAALSVDPPVNLLRRHERRAALIERLTLAGFPQVWLHTGAMS
ncbi:MAG TPA: hypothetical protein VHF06_23820, partial [Pseudonocardiaceae bacterium]|nr:hypothetical protein [Pseudonocardiaceae bacterium]